MHSPIEIFKSVWREAMIEGTSKHRNAVCVSTIDANGFPSSRFVDLKEAEESGFVFCSHLDSAKAIDIQRNPKTGITLWWEHISTQVRIQGISTAISEHEADEHWARRLRDAQIATATFHQSHPLPKLASLSEQYLSSVAAYEGRAIPRPRNWGGFRLHPQHIEFLAFRESRLHERTAYSRVGHIWEKSFLQP